MENVLLPELGEEIEKATVARWHCREGSTVKRDDDIVEMVTDKATFNVSAPIDGKIVEIFVREGEEAKVGGVLATIEPLSKKKGI